MAALFDEGIQITNTESTTATKVNVQEANGEVNTQAINTGFNKNIGLGGSDVVGANTLLNQYSTTPIDWTSTAFNSGQVVFYGGKQWIAKIATVDGDVPAVSPKWEEITFESLANKTTTVDQTIIDGSTNAVSGNAVFDAFNNKQDALGYPPENVANKANDFTTVNNTLYPSVHAVNTKIISSKNYVNVKDYGAIGNGITDDTASVNAAFSALISLGGGTLFFPKGVYHSVTGYTFTGDNINIVGDGVPITDSNNMELIGGTIIRGQVLIDGDNVLVKNLGVDFGITYSDTYRSGIGGNALVIHDATLLTIQKNIKVENVIGLIRLGDYTDAQAAYHAILVEGVQYGSMINVQGVGGWFGVVVKATDFIMNGITGRSNDTASIYIKSNSYAPANRVVAANLIVENYSSRGYVGVLVQASDAEMETISIVNVSVAGGITAFRAESETTNPIVSLSLAGLTARNVEEGVSIRGAVYSPVISDISIYKPDGAGLSVVQNSAGQNAVDLTASNVRVVPSITTVNSVTVGNTNTKALLSNINTSDADGKTLVAGSVIDLQIDSDISNYVGVLKRAGVVSDVYRFKGGGVTTSVANISSTTNTRVDLANPFLSLATGYLGTDNPYIQSYNNLNLTSNRLDINPFGGNTFFGGEISATSYTGGASLTGTPTAPTAPAGTKTTQVATTAFVQANARPYKVYTALLSQIGNAAPTATVLENTLGGTVVWSRTGTGVYTATLNGAFPLGKTTVMPFFGTINGGVNLSQTISGVRIDNNSVGIRTSAGGTLTDVLLLDATIEIRVYN